MSTLHQCRISTTLMALVAIGQTGCFITPQLLDNTDPHEYVLVEDDSITEEQLIGSGIAYKEDKRTGRLFVPKNGMQKFKDYTVRVLATPVTVTLDAAGAAAVVVVVVSCGWQRGWMRVMAH